MVQLNVQRLVYWRAGLATFLHTKALVLQSAQVDVDLQSQNIKRRRWETQQILGVHS